MLRHLVLGASGFLGAHLTRALAGSGVEVTAVGRRFEGAPQPGVERRVLDLYACPQAELDALLAGCEVVHHLAWSSLPAQAEADPHADQAENVGFMLRLLSAVRRTSARLVFCSSGGTVYGPSEAKTLSEDHPLRPITVYGAGKVAAEVYAGLFADAYGCDVRIARLANPFGSGQKPDRMQGALTRFARLAAVNGPIEIWGDGRVVRDYVHVGDVTDGLLRLSGAQLSDLEGFGIFNLGSGRGASLNDLVELIGSALNRRVEVVYRPGRGIDVARNVLDIARAREILGWSPRVGLEAGVRQLLDEGPSSSRR